MDSWLRTRILFVSFLRENLNASQPLLDRRESTLWDSPGLESKPEVLETACFLLQRVWQNSICLAYYVTTSWNATENENTGSLEYRKESQTWDSMHHY